MEFLGARSFERHETLHTQPSRRDKGLGVWGRGAHPIFVSGLLGKMKRRKREKKNLCT